MRSYRTPKNLITPIVYDNMQREDTKVYLPYASTSQNTTVRDANALTNQSAYYRNEYGTNDGNRAYSENVYESSPLNRVVATKKPGSTYSSKAVNITYATNTSSEVKYFTVDAARSLVPSGNYAAGTLYKITTTDEDNQVAVQYTDKQERLIMERRVNANVNFDTYYVYDDYGHLGWVITPEGSMSLPTATQTASSTFAKRYCYVYTYDGNGKIFKKQLPGKGLESYVYDKAGRMVLYQDGELRLNKRGLLN